MAIDADLEKLGKQIETQLQKEFNEDLEKKFRQLENSAKWATNSEMQLIRKQQENIVGDLQLEYAKKAAQLEKNLDDARATTLKTIGSAELGVKRLEREIELLTKDLAALKKDAISTADLKPLIDRIKKLEK
jgi:ribosomal protein S15P/S13E